MSEANAEAIARRFAEAFNAQDADAVVEATSPECVVTALRSALDGPFRGHDGVRRWVESYWEAVPDVRVSVERVLEADDGQIVLLGRQRGTAKLSGAPFDGPLALVTAREGELTTSITAYASHAEALEAAGLGE